VEYRHPLSIPAAFALAGLFLITGACSKEPGEQPPPAGGAGGGGGTGGGGGSPGDASSPPDRARDVAPATAATPASPSLADLAAFLEAGKYKEAPWIAETPAARERGSTTSPHEKVRVFMNPELVASLRGGRDGFKDPVTGQNHLPHDLGSMAVKELYDEAGTNVLGVAAMLKTEVGISLNSWVYFCHGPDGRCLVERPSPKEAPVYGRGYGVACGFCHGGLVYTKAPPP
jgi:hypothetical protein